jgi:hypothetical protein
MSFWSMACVTMWLLCTCICAAAVSSKMKLACRDAQKVPPIQSNFDCDSDGLAASRPYEWPVEHSASNLTKRSCHGNGVKITNRQRTQEVTECWSSARSHALKQQWDTMTLLPASIFDKIKTFVIFVANARSGHTLIGSLIDAHPNAMVSNELNVLQSYQELKKGGRNNSAIKSELFTLMLENSASCGACGIGCATP